MTQMEVSMEAVDLLLDKINGDAAVVVLLILDWNQVIGNDFISLKSRIMVAAGGGGATLLKLYRNRSSIWMW